MTSLPLRLAAGAALLLFGVTAVLSLGSNLGDRLGHLRNGVADEA